MLTIFPYHMVVKTSIESHLFKKRLVQMKLKFKLTKISVIYQSERIRIKKSREASHNSIFLVPMGYHLMASYKNACVINVLMIATI